LTLCYVGYGASRSKQGAFPFTREVTVDYIASAGNRLWKELVGGDDARTSPMKITNVQLAFTGVETADPGQQSIEGFLNPDKLDPAQKRRRTASDSSELIPNGGNASEDVFFECPRCKKRIHPSRSDSGEADQAAVSRLTTLKMEHEDFHFALDLARDPAERDETTKGSRLSKKAKKAEPRGIAKFFAPR
jgi:DNA polymerase eta